MDQSCLKKIILYMNHKSSRFGVLFLVSVSQPAWYAGKFPTPGTKVSIISSPRTGLEHMLVALGQLVLSIVIIIVNVLLVLV